jgi:hypothetical protein
MRGGRRIEEVKVQFGPGVGQLKRKPFPDSWPAHLAQLCVRLQDQHARRVEQRKARKLRPRRRTRTERHIAMPSQRSRPTSCTSATTSTSDSAASDPPPPGLVVVRMFTVTHGVLTEV